MNLESLAATELPRSVGATVIGDGRCRFRVWAPTHQQISVDLIDQDRLVPMEAEGGYHVAEIDSVTAGQRYAYRIGDGPPRPDPASRFQPEGVHGPSEVVDPAFDWSDVDWSGVAKEDLIIYEMHVGTFTEEGTFDAARTRLDELVDLGVTAVELMPVADSAGRWNWGYDGVCLFAPNRNFGRPDSLRRFVDDAHGKGLAVILDVVYNHLGPEGNYWSDFGPYLSSRQTPWGAAPNFDDSDFGEGVRRLTAANAVYWFDEFHFDALRVDAIHCMLDHSPRHVAEDIAAAVHDWSAASKRPAMMIAETNVYDSRMVTGLEQGGIGFDAQWCDDFLHSVFAILRPQEQLCHREYRSGNDLDQTLRCGYVYEGRLDRHKQTKTSPCGQPQRRSPAERVDTHGMIYSIQNHDFIGNHPLGQRLHQLTSPEAQRSAAALLLLTPAIPMLFMGEEFLCPRPFQFFVDFGDEHLHQATIEGRMREYPQHDWSGGRLPTDPDAFEHSKIGPASAGDATTRVWYRSLIRLRKQLRGQRLLADEYLSVQSDLDHGFFHLIYEDGVRSLSVAVRLNAEQEKQDPMTTGIEGDLLLDSRDESTERDQLWCNHAKVFRR